MPDSRASSDRYAPILQAIHWLITLLVVAQFTFILCTSRFQSFEFANTVLAWHRVCGLILVVLIITRIAARFWAPAPRLWRMPLLQACAAHFIHGAMLAVLVALAAVGIVMAGARGDTVSIFGLFDVPAVIDYDPDLSDRLLIVHGWLAATLAGLIAVHIGAVVFHLLVQKRNVMRRMLPAFKRSGLVNHVPIWGQMALGSGCLLALMIGVGAYAERETANATRLNQALFNEIFGVSADIALLDNDYAEFMLNFGGPGRERLMESISPLKGGAIDIKQKTEDPSARDLADTVHGKLVLIETATQNKQDLGQLLGDTDQAIDDLKGGHVDFVFRQRLAVEKASAFAHDMILISIIPATLLGLMVAIVLSRNLLRAFGTARSLATSITSGNLENDLRVEGQGEAAQLARDLLSMQIALRQNISALKATASALQQSENRIRGVAENLPGFLFQCFRAQDGGIRFRVIGSNKFEFASSTMTLLQNGGDLSLDFVMEEDRLNLEKTILAADDSGPSWEHTFRVPALDGSLRWVRATAGLAQVAGMEKAWNGIALDETDRIATAAQYAQLQARLRQAEKIKSIGTLAGGMAHEINNLLQPVIMMTELVLMDMPEDSDHRVRLQRVIDAGSMAAEIVQRLGAFGRAQEVSQDLLDIADVGRDAVAFIRTILPTSVTLHVE